MTSLDRFVARAGEETGFVPHGQPQIFSTARGWVAVEPPRQAKRDAARLRREGFVLGIFQEMTSTHDPKNRAGASSVLGLGSSTAARAEQRVEMREEIAALNPKDMIRRVHHRRRTRRPRIHRDASRQRSRERILHGRSVLAVSRR